LAASQFRYFGKGIQVKYWHHQHDVAIIMHCPVQTHPPRPRSNGAAVPCLRARGNNDCRYTFSTAQEGSVKITWPCYRFSTRNLCGWAWNTWSRSSQLWELWAVNGGCYSLPWTTTMPMSNPNSGSLSYHSSIGGEWFVDWTTEGLVSRLGVMTSDREYRGMRNIAPVRMLH
jgi:hypothetical protein